MKHCHWIVLYDISDPKRLRDTEKIVSRYGTRIQKSVFEIDAKEGVVNILEKKLTTIIEDNDFVAILPLCSADWQKMVKYGIINSDEYMKGDFLVL